MFDQNSLKVERTREKSHANFTNVCCLVSESIELIKKMIDQVVSVHSSASWLHVGGDEVRKSNQEYLFFITKFEYIFFSADNRQHA